MKNCDMNKLTKRITRTISTEEALEDAAPFSVSDYTRHVYERTDETVDKLLDELIEKTQINSLENYKNDVRECLMKTYNCTIQETNKLMTEYEQILPEYYGLKLTPIEMACAMIRGY